MGIYFYATAVYTLIGAVVSYFLLRDIITLTEYRKDRLSSSTIYVIVAVAWPLFGLMLIEPEDFPN